jgi:outer membrane protein
VRKLLLSSAVLACLASVFVNAYGQNAGTGGTKKSVAPASATASQAEPPHKIALIDMGRVFKEYKKIEVLKEDWKAEFQVNEENAKKMTAQIQQVIEQMKEFKQGSPEFIKLEKQQTDLAARLGAFKQTAQRELLRKEADLLKTVYLEAMDVVERFADHFGYTLVMRFSSDTFEGEDMNKMQTVMNRTIIFHRPEDDLTDGVIRQLNKQFAGGQPKAANKEPGAGGARKN